jgi:hypothetical protein
MNPLPVNPTVVLRVVNGQVISVASNVAPDLRIIVTNNMVDFDYEAANQPFAAHNNSNVIYGGKYAFRTDLPPYLQHGLMEKAPISDLLNS